ncbi:MAG: MaoC/PaaZ C-terminal domain-containing protein [Alphaproteobacteria bacterium]|jgi:acyl dehydratase|nr:3-alpha,7-alpha,12-alpha-trihydroxy-5-beta-cholest-24-enoyl-CoA hydratase [Rhodospirillaceae bacterium]MDG2479469.1 MaoC/PaaZ C-terminal domain-containing protein [Alphaproteobacteria bacterium]MBT6202671.1 3-alpha,7-alpha,12-alpha-trihydroxy-5-beta-cholest-24-enoyl-CoA hydratase [Rhodospirillaceae bacterium]MBT6509646.1 3-alpha,7-alpha,12-alpha-trihydroxy-5-beta-cholest-24-enoyl-CoA hydratase [Rhodospirillaceae bacterium]MBT7615458.1 3-alpha,7-alpha,12-alpha-trihydroxy-5-beta-cholest-24-eno
MAIDYEKLKAWDFGEHGLDWRWQDSALYALGVGLGFDPEDNDQLRFTWEEDMLALPTMAVVLASSHFWLRDPETGVDWKKVVHGEEGMVLHRPLPSQGSFVTRSRIDEIIDKGEGRGALIYMTREVFDATTDEPVATITRTTFARGDGGFGGPSGPVRSVHKLPDRAPDHVCDLPTLPQQALIYRLNGDGNPLHADPDVAREAGFERPILHGLCTFGVAGHAVLKTLCGYEPAGLKRFDVRFSAPVFPGETIRTEMWVDGTEVSFRARVVERDAVVLNNGLAEIA